MADYRTIKAALAARLDTSANLSVVYVQVPDVYTTPCAVLVPGDTPAQYHATMQGQGLTVFEFRVQVMVQRFDLAAAADALDVFVHGPDSVDALVRADRTLGGVVVDAVVDTCENYGQVLAGDDVYLGAEFDLRVMVRP